MYIMYHVQFDLSRKKFNFFYCLDRYLLFHRSDLYSDGSSAISHLVFVPKPDSLGPVRRCVDFFFAILATPNQCVFHLGSYWKADRAAKAVKVAVVPVSKANASISINMLSPLLWRYCRLMYIMYHGWFDLSSRKLKKV